MSNNRNEAQLDPFAWLPLLVPYNRDSVSLAGLGDFSEAR